MRKKRILFCSEATFVNTGYATYTREILNDHKGDNKFIAVQFFIPTSGYANFDSAGNLFTDFSFRDQQIDFLIKGLLIT